LNQPFSTPLSPLRIVVLISGEGTTLRNLIQKIAARQLDAAIVSVIASRADAGGLAHARAAQIPVEVVDRKAFASREAFSAALFDECRAASPDLVVLGGFLQRLAIAPDFENRLVNIHPSLIPAFSGEGFYGRHVHQAVLRQGAKVSGCTVHFLDDQYDHGPIVLQRCVRVLADDTPASLAARVFAAECEAYPTALRLIASGRLRIEGRLTRVDA